MNNKICTLENYNDICPLHDAHDKLEEAYYFLLMMAFSYHKPNDFRFNLDAFLQALRSVTFMLQKDKSKITDFDDWYTLKRKEMEVNPYLKNVSDARTIIVHQRSLKAKSKIDVGLYRRRRQKLCISFNDLDPFLESELIFSKMVPQFAKIGFIDEEHSALGEQLGIRREWHSEELGDKEVLLTCYEAYISMCDIMIEAHSFFDLQLVPQSLPEDLLEKTYVLLESDLDPSLPKKWGWCD